LKSDYDNIITTELTVNTTSDSMPNGNMIEFSNEDLIELETIINESKKNIEALYKEVKEILVENKDKLTRLAFELLDKETLNECDLDSIVSA